MHTFGPANTPRSFRNSACRGRQHRLHAAVDVQAAQRCSPARRRLEDRLVGRPGNTQGRAVWTQSPAGACRSWRCRCARCGGTGSTPPVSAMMNTECGCRTNPRPSRSCGSGSEQPGGAATVDDNLLAGRLDRQRAAVPAVFRHVGAVVVAVAVVDVGVVLGAAAFGWLRIVHSMCQRPVDRFTATSVGWPSCCPGQAPARRCDTSTSEPPDSTGSTASWRRLSWPPRYIRYSSGYAPRSASDTRRTTSVPTIAPAAHLVIPPQLRRTHVWWTTPASTGPAWALATAQPVAAALLHRAGAALAVYAHPDDPEVAVADPGSLGRRGGRGPIPGSPPWGRRGRPTSGPTWRSWAR